MADRTTTLHAPPLVRINLAQAASNIEDLHKHLIEIAAWLDADDPQNAEAEVLAMFVGLKWLRQSLGLEFKLVANTPSQAEPGACEVRDEPEPEVPAHD